MKLSNRNWAAGVHSSKFVESIAEVPVRQRAVPALAIVCALSSEASQPVAVNLLKGLRFCLLVGFNLSSLRRVVPELSYQCLLTGICQSVSAVNISGSSLR